MQEYTIREKECNDMQEYTIRAAIEITATGTGTSPEDVLEKALKSKKFEITDAKLDSRIIDNYITVKEFGEKHNIANTSYFSRQCQAGIIPGVKRFAHTYLIPKDTQHIDRRLVDGKWVGQYEKYGKKQWAKKRAAQLEAIKAEMQMKRDSDAENAPERPE